MGAQMDFYIAALGRSGSTALANWLTTPPTHLVFHEPNLLREKPTRLFHMQLEDWNVDEESAFAAHWAVKETQADMHSAMVARFKPSKVLICVRRVRDAALSLFEKHRRQNLLHRYSDAWSADYLVREATGLVSFAEELDQLGIPNRTIRYEDFGEEALQSVAAWVGWPGGGDYARGFVSFGRGYEMDRQRNRELPEEAARMADAIADQCKPFEERFYP
jgi:hypothetical protein